MRIKQGGSRKLPDGYLHLNNFSHRKDSGILGSFYERVMTPTMQREIEDTLKYKAMDEDLMSPQRFPRVHYKHAHGALRFRKEWLKANFPDAVRSLIKKNELVFGNTLVKIMEKELG